MRPGETIATYDVGLALRGKSGRFEVTSPTGEVYDVTCKNSHSISNPEWASNSNGTDHPPFLIRKVAEGASLAEPSVTTTAMTDAEDPTASPRVPFVLERATDDGQSSSGGNIELLYVEDDGTGQPSACLYLKSESLEHSAEAEKSLTSRCATLNELDSEIRRLQAQLDEIQSRAKKMFYKAYAMAESA